jgi:hypothetical protein
LATCADGFSVRCRTVEGIAQAEARSADQATSEAAVRHLFADGVELAIRRAGDVHGFEEAVGLLTELADATQRAAAEGGRHG